MAWVFQGPPSRNLLKNVKIKNVFSRGLAACGCRAELFPMFDPLVSPQDWMSWVPQSADIADLPAGVLRAVSVTDAATQSLYEELRRHDVPVLRLDPGMGVDDLIDWLGQGPGGYSALHLYSHGSPGRFQIGGQEIASGVLPSLAGALANLGSLLAPDADLLIYGCSVGAGSVGSELLSDLAALTSADVASSLDPTGGEAGANWDLEVVVGSIEPWSEDVNLDLDWNRSLAITPGAAVTSASYLDGNGDLVNILLTGNGTFKLELSGGLTNNADALRLELTGTDQDSDLSISVTPVEQVINAGSVLQGANGIYSRTFSSGYTTIDRVVATGIGAIGDIRLSAAIVNTIDMAGFAIGSIQLEAGLTTYVDRVNTSSPGGDISVAAPSISVENVTAAAELELFDESPTGGRPSTYNPVTGLIDLGDVLASSIDSLIINGSISAPTFDPYDDAELTNDLGGTIEVSGHIGLIQAQRSSLNGSIRAGSIGDIDLGLIQGAIVTQDASMALSIDLASEFRGFISAAGHLNLGFSFDYLDPGASVPPSERIYGEIHAGGGISGSAAVLDDALYLPNQLFNLIRHTGSARTSLGAGYDTAFGVSVSDAIADVVINGLGTSRLISAGNIGSISANSFGRSMIVEAVGNVGNIEAYLYSAAPSTNPNVPAQQPQPLAPVNLDGFFKAGGNIGTVRSATNVAADLRASGDIGNITALSGGITSKLIEAGQSIGNLWAHSHEVANSGKIVAKAGSIGSVDLGLGNWGSSLSAGTDIGAINLVKGDLAVVTIAAGGSIGAIKVNGTIQGGSIVAADDIGPIDVTATKGVAIDGALIQAGGDAGDRLVSVRALSYGATVLPEIIPGLQPAAVPAFAAIRNSQFLAAEIGSIWARSLTGTGMVDTVIHAQRASIDMITGIGNQAGLLRVTAVAEQDLALAGIEGQSQVRGSGIDSSRFNANTGAMGLITAQGGVAGGHGVVDSTFQAAKHQAGFAATSNANQGDAIRRVTAYAGTYGTIKATVLGGEGAAPVLPPPPAQRVATGSGIVDSQFTGYTNLPSSPDPGIAAIIVNTQSLQGNGIANSQFLVKDSISSISVKAFSNTAVLNSRFSTSRGVIGSIDAEATNRGSAISGSTFSASNGDIGLFGGLKAVASGSGLIDHAIELSTFNAANGIGQIEASAKGGTGILGSTFTADTDFSGSGLIGGIKVINSGQNLVSSAGISGSSFDAAAIGAIDVAIDDFEGGAGISGSTFTTRTATYDGKGNFDNRGTIGSVKVDSLARSANGIESSRFFAGAAGSIGNVDVDLITRKLRGGVDGAANGSSGKGIYLSTFQASSFDFDQNVWNGSIGNITVKAGRVLPTLLPPVGTPPNDQFTAATAGVDLSYFAALGGIGDITIETIGSGVFGSAFLADSDVAGINNLIAGTLLSSLAADVPGNIGNVTITSNGRFAVGSALSLFTGAGIGNLRIEANAINVATSPIPKMPTPSGPLETLVQGLIQGATALLPGVPKLLSDVIKANDRFGLAAVVGSTFAALKGDIGSIQVINSGSTGKSALASIFLAKNSYGPIEFEKPPVRYDSLSSTLATSILWVAGYPAADVYLPDAVLVAGKARGGKLPGVRPVLPVGIVAVPGSSSLTPFAAGATVPFDVNFGGPVVVTGQPFIALTVNGESRKALYSSGSGSGTLRFTYTVEVGDRATVGAADVQLPTKLTTDAANSVRYRNGSQPIQAVTLRTLGDPTSLAFDGVAPEVLTNTLTGTTATAGSVLKLKVVFDEIVNVTGKPQVEVMLGTNKRFLKYSSGAGTNTLFFTYTVTQEDVLKTLRLTGTQISLPTVNGVRQSITDLAGNPASLNLQSAPEVMARVTAGISPFSTGPTVLGFQSPAVLPKKAGQFVNVTVQFSEAIMVSGKPFLEASIGANGPIRLVYAGGAGTDRLTFRYALTQKDLLAGQDFMLVPKIVLPTKLTTLRSRAGSNAALQMT